MPIKIETTETVRFFNSMVETFDVITNYECDRAEPAEILQRLPAHKNTLDKFQLLAQKLGYDV